MSSSCDPAHPRLFLGEHLHLFRKCLRDEQASAHALEIAVHRRAYDIPLAEALSRIYHRAIALYTSNTKRPTGCFLIGTAATEAVGDLEIRKVFAAGLHELDEQLEARIRHAIEHKDLETSMEPAVLARLACGIMNALAVRARGRNSCAAQRLGRRQRQPHLRPHLRAAAEDWRPCSERR